MRTNTIDKIEAVLEVFRAKKEPFTPRDIAEKLFEQEGKEKPFSLHLRTMQLETYINSMFCNGLMPGWAKTYVTTNLQLYFWVPELVYTPSIGAARPGEKGAGRKSNKDEVVDSINRLNNKLIQIRKNTR